MKKYVYSTLLWTIVLMISFMIHWFIESAIFWMEVYTLPPFIDWTWRMWELFVYVVLTKAFYAFILSYVHEKIPRCGSSLWTKSWRFAGMTSLLVYFPWLSITALTMQVEPAMIISWALGWYFSTLICSIVIIHVLYKFPVSNPACEIRK